MTMSDQCMNEVDAVHRYIESPDGQRFIATTCASLLYDYSLPDSAQYVIGAYLGWAVGVGMAGERTAQQNFRKRGYLDGAEVQSEMKDAAVEIMHAVHHGGEEFYQRLMGCLKAAAIEGQRTYVATNMPVPAVQPLTIPVRRYE